MQNKIGITVTVSVLMLISFIDVKAQGNLQSGLYFASHEVVQDQRTSLDLTPDKPFSFPNGFSMQFDIKFRRDDGYFGYIFRIIGNGKTNIDLVSNLAAQSTNFWLIRDEETLFSYKWDDLPQFDYEQWATVRIDVDTHRSMIAFIINGSRQEMWVPGVDNLKDFKISFGACKLDRFQSSDVCPMSIRNIQINKSSKQPYRYWKLDRHSVDCVYDEVDMAKASVRNPIWLIDRYITWNHVADLQIERLLGITPDAEGNRLFMVNPSNIYVFDTETFRVDTLTVESGTPYNEISERNIIYNKFTDEIWSYSFSKPVVSRFDFTTNRWSESLQSANESTYAQHNKIISPADSSLVTLFGYGFYTYKSVINHYDRRDRRWNVVDISDRIGPRYLSCVGFKDDDNLLVFGGYGSRSGKQELMPGCYYDLYRLNLRDNSIDSIWTLPAQQRNFVPSETLIVNNDDSVFYALTFDNGQYNTSLKLMEFNIDKPEARLVGDSIEFKFRDSESSVALYLNRDNRELIAGVTTNNGNVSLYSIAYPPLAMNDVMQTPKRLDWSRFLVYAAIAIILGGGGALWIVRRGGTGSRKASRPNMLKLDYSPKWTRPDKSSVCLLGDLRIRDEKGTDISNMFPPTLKQLFLYVLINSSDGRGVSSMKLDGVLWADKSEESARNNRNVNISKLRNILDGVPGIDIENNGSMWRINLSHDYYCDYFDICRLMQKARSGRLEHDETERFLSLLDTGELLSGLHGTWVDVCRNSHLSGIADTLNSVTGQLVESKNYDMLFYAVEKLLTVDPFNERALSIKCSLLEMADKHYMAVKAYESFADGYKKLLGTEYSVAYKAVVKQDLH